MPRGSCQRSGRRRRFGVAGLATVLAAPAGAVTPVTPVGVESCDAFLDAYAQCAASPGVPEAVRPNIRQGIGTLRESFRDAVSRTASARPTVAQQCAQAHEAVRKSMVDAFRCDFPAPPPASQALLQAVPPAPVTQAPAMQAPAMQAPARADARVAPFPPSREAQEVAKANAYTEVQNHLVRSHPLERQLAEYRRDNERVLKLGTKLGANAWYHFGIVDFDGVIDELEKAAALPGTIPEIDPQATRLLAALRELNPTLKALTRYQTMREFKEDGYKFAREQHTILVPRVEAAAKAMDAFGTALFERELARDERRMARLPEDAPARRLLATSLALRRAVQRFEALGPKADTAPFLAALGDVSTANRQLGATFDGMNPKASTSCTGYADTVASVIGHGRDVARDIKAKGDPSQPARLFNDTYNRSVRDLESCQRYESRARPS
ncbi:hypothetical protein FOHLNKBM_4678 [Methylobacterium longum]|nr:hypothetical protein FOHLNKBM_4678 [Methylobacterium longum]